MTKPKVKAPGFRHDEHPIPPLVPRPPLGPPPGAPPPPAVPPPPPVAREETAAPEAVTVPQHLPTLHALVQGFPPPPVESAAADREEDAEIPAAMEKETCPAGQDIDAVGEHPKEEATIAETPKVLDLAYLNMSHVALHVY